MEAECSFQPFCKSGLYRELEWNTYSSGGHRYCAVRDISHQQMVEQELRHVNQQLFEKELQMSTIVDNIGDGLITFDASGTIHAFNAAASTIFGYAMDQVIGTNISTRIPGGAEGRRGAEIDAPWCGGPSWLARGNFVFPALRKDGSVLHIELIVNAVETGHGELFVAVLRDGTESRKASSNCLTKRSACASPSIRSGGVITTTPLAV